MPKSISAVLFDLDETLLDRTASLEAFLADQHRRFAPQLGHAAFDTWRDRFLALDVRGSALTTLRSNGLKLAIVTNGETAFQSRHIEALGLRDLVDAILISEAEGLRKPDAALFARVARSFGVDPGACLFVGDNPIADIAGAQAAGMQALWFRSGKTWPANAPPLTCRAIDLPQILEELGLGQNRRA